MAITYDISRAGAEAMAVSGHVPQVGGQIIKATNTGGVSAFTLVEAADGTGEAVFQLPATAGNACQAVSLETAADGEESLYFVGVGICKLTLGATLTAPAEFSSATTGKAVAAGTTGHIVTGEVWEDGVDTDVKLVYLYGGAGRAVP